MSKWTTNTDMLLLVVQVTKKKNNKTKKRIVLYDLLKLHRKEKFTCIYSHWKLGENCEPGIAFPGSHFLRHQCYHV